MTIRSLRIAVLLLACALAGPGHASPGAEAARDAELSALAARPPALRHDLLSRYVSGGWQEALDRAQRAAALAFEGRPPFDGAAVVMDALQAAGLVHALVGRSQAGFLLVLEGELHVSDEDARSPEIMRDRALAYALVQTGVGGFPATAVAYFDEYFDLVAAGAAVPPGELTASAMIAAGVGERLRAGGTFEARVRTALSGVADLDPADPMTLVADVHFLRLAAEHLAGDERAHALGAIARRAAARSDAIVHQAALAEEKAALALDQPEAGQAIVVLEGHLAAMETALPPAHEVKLGLLRQMAVASVRIGAPDRAEAIYRRTVAMAGEMDLRPFERATVEQDLAGFLISAGRVAEAVELSRRAYDAVEDDPRRPLERANTAMWLGSALAHAGRLDEALAHVRDGRRRFVAGLPQGARHRLWAGTWEADILDTQGALAEARNVLRETAAEIEAAGAPDAFAAASLHARIGDVSLRMGDVAAAAAAFGRAVGHATTLMARSEQAAAGDRTVLAALRPVVELQIQSFWTLAIGAGDD